MSPYVAPIVVSLAGGVALGGSQVQSLAVNLDTDLEQWGMELSFDQFDSQGGTRELTAVNLSFTGDLFIEVTAQSYHPEFIAAGTWSADAYHNVLISFFPPDDGGGDGDDGRGFGAPFYGLGGIGILGFTGDLTPGTPGDGPFDPGTPGDPVTDSYADSLNSVIDTDPAYFDYFTGNGTVTGFGGPFTDILVSPPDGFPNFEVFASRLTQVGTLSLEYVYRDVPTPAGLALFGAAGMMGLRRRRG